MKLVPFRPALGTGFSASSTSPERGTLDGRIITEPSTTTHIKRARNRTPSRRAAVRGHDRACVTSKKEDTHTRSACMHGDRKHKHARRFVDKLSPIPFFQFSIVLHVYVSVYLHTLLWLFTAAIILVFHHDSSDLALDYDYNSSA